MLIRDTIQLLFSGYGYVVYAYQREIRGWHDKGIGACTGVVIHLQLLELHGVGGDGLDGLELVTGIGLDGDLDGLAFLGQLLIDRNHAAVIVHEQHSLRFDIRGYSDVSGACYIVVEEGLIGLHVHRVGVYHFVYCADFGISRWHLRFIVIVALTVAAFTVTFIPIIRSPRVVIDGGGGREFHVIDGMSVISLSFDGDDIILHHLDGLSLFARNGVAQCHVSVFFLVNAHRGFHARRRIFDGGVAGAHREDKHVFVLDGLAIRGKQQAEVVEYRTFIAALVNVFGLAFYQHLHLGGCAIDGKELALGDKVIHLSGKVGNDLGFSLVIPFGYDSDPCQPRTVGHDTGNGSNFQFITLLGIVGDGEFSEVDRLLHAVASAGTPEFIAFGMGKGLDGELLTFGGIFPTIHTLFSKAVLQHIMVHHRIARARCSVSDTEGFVHEENHRNILSHACHAGIARNHLGNEGLDAIGFLGVIDADSMNFLNTILDRDFLHIHLEAINGLPSAAFKTLRAHKPRRLAARDGYIGRDVALISHQRKIDLFASLRSVIAQRGLNVVQLIGQNNFIILLAEDGSDMYGLVRVWQPNHDGILTSDDQARIDIGDFDIDQFVSVLMSIAQNGNQDDRHVGQILYHDRVVFYSGPIQRH